MGFPDRSGLAHDPKKPARTRSGTGRLFKEDHAQKHDEEQDRWM
jgi:hypothetical protein